MTDPDDDGLLSATAESFIAMWRNRIGGNATMQAELARNFVAFAANIRAQVKPTPAFDAALERAIEYTATYCKRRAMGSTAELDILADAADLAVAQVETAARKAGLSDLARALGA